MPSPFHCSPVIRKCSWKKTQIEKIYIYAIRFSVIKIAFITRDVRNIYRDHSFSKYVKFSEKLTFFISTLKKVLSRNKYKGAFQQDEAPIGMVKRRQYTGNRTFKHKRLFIASSTQQNDNLWHSKLNLW